MSEFTVPYGKGHLGFNIPDGIDLARLRDIRSAAIAINDKTRPVPHQHLLPPLLHRIEALGLPPEAITLIIATGMHPPMPSKEYPRVVPEEVLARYPVLCHDAEDRENLLHLGTTSRGTPVWVNRHFVRADWAGRAGHSQPQPRDDDRSLRPVGPLYR